LKEGVFGQCSGSALFQKIKEKNCTDSVTTFEEEPNGGVKNGRPKT